MAAKKLEKRAIDKKGGACRECELCKDFLVKLGPHFHNPVDQACVQAWCEANNGSTKTARNCGSKKVCPHYIRFYKNQVKRLRLAKA